VRVVYSPKHSLHDAEHDVQAGVPTRHWERPSRAEAIREALQQDGRFTFEPPTQHGLAPIEAVHARGLVAFLEEAWQVWRAATVAPEMFPDTVMHPRLRDGMGECQVEPRAPIGRLGYWGFDTGTPIVPGTYEAARASADVAVTASDLVLGGESAVYGLCRPPGHHTAHAVYGGFCYFNNAAIAAEHLVRQSGERVAVLDVDYHHGNGTQQIFYQRSDVPYVSLHGDPMRAYPFFVGHSDETGAADGAGSNLNIPLPVGATNEQYLAALDRALEALVAFKPSVTVVSLGMDTYGQDPLGDFSLTTPVYAEMGKRVAAAAGRLVILQEGGYYLPHLGENVRQWLLGASPSSSP
jgi:acetoin utilization deacetylase AcuC-like enzyme